MRRLGLALAFLAPATLAGAQDRMMAPPTTDQPLTDYCTLERLSPGSCAPGVNYAVAATCPSAYQAVAVSCFISDLYPPLTINAASGSRGVCDWFFGHPPDPQTRARATLLCLRTVRHATRK